MNVCMHVCIHIMWALYIYVMYVNVGMHADVFTSVCMYVYMDVSTYYVYRHVCLSVCLTLRFSSSSLKPIKISLSVSVKYQLPPDIINVC